MIRLNNRPYPYTQGLTIAALLKAENFIYPRIVVHLNGVLVEPERYGDTPIHDGDTVLAVHLMAGG